LLEEGDREMHRNRRLARAAFLLRHGNYLRGHVGNPVDQ
jgi:hypothetical protein